MNSPDSFTHDRFLELVAHELRTGATIVLGDARVLDARPELPDSELIGLVTDLEGARDRIAVAVDNVLRLAHAERGEPALESVLVPDAVGRALLMHELECPESRPVVSSGQWPTLRVVAVRQWLTDALNIALWGAWSCGDQHCQVEWHAEGDVGVISVVSRRRRRDASVATGLELANTVAQRLIERMAGTLRTRRASRTRSILEIELPLASP